LPPEIAVTGASGPSERALATVPSYTSIVIANCSLP
jgi:hypothetical protein